MKLKYFIASNDIAKAVETYKKLFQARVVKQDDHHANILLFNQINILIHGGGSSQPKEGIIILRFSAEEVQLYLDVVKALEDFGWPIGIKNHASRWGTTFTEFRDPFGYMWDLEVDTKALEGQGE